MAVHAMFGSESVVVGGAFARSRNGNEVTMKLRKFAAVSAMVAASVGITAGTACAAPAPEQEKITYESKVEDRAVVTTIDAGLFKVAGDGRSVELKDNAGNVVVSLPLAYQLGDLQFPFQEQVSEDGKTLRLVPSTNPAEATPIPPEKRVLNLPLHNAASPQENLAAQDNFSSQLDIASTVGGLAGTIIGGTIGLVGLAAGPVALATVPTLAAVGGIAGTIAVGGPALIISGMDLLDTWNAPAGTTKYATK